MLSFSTLLADRGRYGDHDGGGFFFLFLILLGFGIYFAVRAIRRRRGTWPEPRIGGGAQQLLDERFARGEIDRAEYDHRKAVLDGADVIPPAPAASAPSSAGAPTAAASEPGATMTMPPPAETAETTEAPETAEAPDAADAAVDADGSDEPDAERDSDR